MRISKKSEYAIRALVAMARNPKPYQIHELSTQENIPVKFLEQILLILRHAGMLASKRGAGGGYALRTPSSQITVGEVIRTMDGPLAPVPCVAKRPVEQCTCPDPLGCPLRLLMQEVRDELSAILDQRTIEDLIRMNSDRSTLAFDI